MEHPFNNPWRIDPRHYEGEDDLELWRRRMYQEVVVKNRQERLRLEEERARRLQDAASRAEVVETAVAPAQPRPARTLCRDDEQEVVMTAQRLGVTRRRLVSDQAPVRLVVHRRRICRD